MKDELKDYPVDVDENTLFRKSRELLKILLTDRTTNRNIIWATNTYERMGKGFGAKDSITIKHVTGEQVKLIRPRIEKMKYEQKNRTKRKAEVFTPTWIVKMQNDVVEQEFSNLSLKEYTAKIWLEITCGEAPYMVNRYDAVSGNPVSLSERVGFLDRKLQRINAEIDNPSEWIIFVKKAYESSFGYEFQGDSLLIARENLLYTFIDYYQEKFKYEPDLQLQLDIARIISYNVFQADGLKDIVPLSEKTSGVEQISLFEDFFEPKIFKQEMSGVPVKIKNWRSKRMVEFRMLKKGDESMKFDVVIGNPPYQEDRGRNEDGSRQRDEPIYHLFMNQAFLVGKKVELITPGRFLFNVGQTPKAWNRERLDDPHFKVIHFEEDSSRIFPNTDIKGGIVITYRDNGQLCDSIGTFFRSPMLKTISDKVINSEFVSITTIAFSSMSYKFSDAFFNNQLNEKKDYIIRTNSFSKYPEYFLDNIPIDEKKNNYLRVIGKQDSSRVTKYIKKSFIEQHPNLNKWKVFLPKASGKGEFGEKISSPIIAGPRTAANQTFMSIGIFNSELEASNCLKFLKSKFSRALFGILKVTQDNHVKTWKYVPLQDFTSNSDIDWSKTIHEIDEMLYTKYGLSEEEINFIESKVKEMD